MSKYKLKGKKMTEVRYIEADCAEREEKCLRGFFNIHEHGNTMKQEPLSKEIMNALTDSGIETKEEYTDEEIMEHKEQMIVNELKKTNAKIVQVNTMKIGKRRFKRNLAKIKRKQSRQIA